jgi:hypothetical protein
LHRRRKTVERTTRIEAAIQALIEARTSILRSSKAEPSL